MSTPTDKPLIVVADDDEAGRYARARALRKAGHTVVEASTGEEALELVDRHNPRLVVLDVQMPGIGGLEACRRLKTNPRTSIIPVLHMSATSITGADQVRGLEGGADGYLVEPVAPEVLVATVTALLRMRRAEDELRESKRAMATLIGNLPGMAYRRRGSDGGLTFVSSGAIELCGYVPDELQSGTIRWEDLIHPEDLSRFQRLTREAQEAQRMVEIVYRIRTRDGDSKWLWDRATPVRSAAGTDWEGFATDVSAVKREAARWQAEALY